MDCDSSSASREYSGERVSVDNMSLLLSIADNDLVAFDHILERSLKDREPPHCEHIELVEALVEFADSKSAWISILIQHLSLLDPYTSDHIRMRLLNVRGTLYRIMGDATNAIEYFYMAAQRAGTEPDRCVNALLGIIGCNLDLGNRNKASELLEFLEVTQPTVKCNPYFSFFNALLDEDPISRSLKLDSTASLCQAVHRCNLSLVLDICNEYMNLKRYQECMQLLMILQSKLPCQRLSVELLLGICYIHDSIHEQDGVDLLSKFSHSSAIAAVVLSRFYTSRHCEAEASSVLSLCVDPSLECTPYYALWKVRSLGPDANSNLLIPILLRAAEKPRMSQDWPEWIQVAKELVSAYIQAGLCEKGLEVLNSLSYPPETSSCLRARLLLALNRHEEALVAAITVDNDELIEIKKEILFQLNRMSDYIKLLPSDPELIGDAFFRFGAVDDSIRWYSECSVVTHRIRKKIAQAYLLCHDFEKARFQVDSILADLLRDQNDTDDCAAFCFSTLIDLEAFEACWEWYSKLSNFLPVKCAEMVLSMCESLGWLDRGIQLAFQYIDRNSVLVGRLALVTLTEKLGLLYFQKERYDEAIFWLSKCFQDTDNVAVVSALIRAMELGGDFDRAQEIVRVCLRRFPELEENVVCTISRTPSEDSIKHLLCLSKSNPWRVVSLIVENRRLGHIEFDYPDPEACMLWDQIQAFEPPKNDRHALIVFGLIGMIEGRISRNTKWLNEHCYEWETVDLESADLLVKFSSNSLPSTPSQKNLYRNCIEFLVFELIEIATFISLAHAVVVKDKGCVMAWKLVGETYPKTDDERYKAWEQYVRLGGNDEAIIQSVGKWYYKTRQYVKFLQLYEEYKLGDLKSEYEKSKIKMYRAY